MVRLVRWSGMGGVISADGPKWIEPFAGLTEVQFARLVALVRHRARWRRSAWPTLAAVAQGLGVTGGYVLAHELHIAAGATVVRSLEVRGRPHLGLSRTAAAISPVRRPRKDAVYIVDGTLVPTRDRSVAASSKYRYSTSLQVVIDADSRLVVVIGLPLPGSRNDCRAFTESGIDRACRCAPTIADGGYQGTGLFIPHCRRRGQSHLSPSQEAENAVHRRARARVEHALSRLKNWKILRDCRLKGDGVHQAMLGIARL